MNKFDVDWCPSVNLGHDKINVDALQNTSERAERTALRCKRMEETVTGSLTVENSIEDPVTGEDTGSINQEIQSTEITYESKIVQTHRLQFCNISVQTDESDFLMRETFWVIMSRCTIILGSVALAC